MAIDPSIALGYRGVELANPLAQYGQIAQIQNAQNQNALAQYQLGAAQRQETTQNVLSDAYAKSVDPATGKIDYNKLTGLLASGGGASQIPGIEKTRREMETAEAQRKKHEFDLKEAQAKFMDQAQRNLSRNPSDDNVRAWGQDAVIDGILSPEQANRTVQELLKLAPEVRVQKLSMAGATAGDLKPHFVTENLGGTSRVSAFPSHGGAPTTLSQSPIVMSEAQIAQNKIAQRNADIAAGRLAVEQKRLAQDATGVVYQEDGNGNIVALPSKLKAGEVPTGRMAVAPGGGFQPMMAKPSEAVGKEQMSINQQKSTVQGALDAVKNTPEAFGWTTGNLPESVRSRLATSPENEARAFVFNVVSGVIKERAGTAQSAGEAATLARFLPAEGDNAKVIEDKLTGFQQYLDAKEKGTTKKRGAPTNPTLAPMDQQALQWANSNPADPRAAAIKQRLGQ